MKRVVLIAIFIGLFAAAVQAAGVMAGTLTISAPWARATPKGASVGGGYMTITNNGTTSDSLVGGSTAIAKQVEVHQMKMENGVMKMRPVTGGLKIDPGQTVDLEPSGYHLMFVGLKQQLTKGEHFKVTLEFAKAGKVDVDFTVQGLGATSAGDMGAMDHSGTPMK